MSILYKGLIIPLDMPSLWLLAKRPAETNALPCLGASALGLPFVMHEA